MDQRELVYLRAGPLSIRRGKINDHDYCYAMLGDYLMIYLTEHDIAGFLSCAYDAIEWMRMSSTHGPINYRSVVIFDKEDKPHTRYMFYNQNRLLGVLDGISSVKLIRDALTRKYDGPPHEVQTEGSISGRWSSSDQDVSRKRD
jgi:hypothetical protein